MQRNLKIAPSTLVRSDRCQGVLSGELEQSSDTDKRDP